MPEELTRDREDAGPFDTLNLSAAAWMLPHIHSERAGGLVEIRAIEERVRETVDESKRYLRAILPFAHAHKRSTDPMVHREQRQLGAIGLHRPGVRRPRRQVRKIAAHHRPAIAGKFELDLPTHHQHGGVTAEMCIAALSRPRSR